jgi:glyoxylase-like metal-dependent hydrolase (beta-lactamase superfamily II)
MDNKAKQIHHNPDIYEINVPYPEMKVRPTNSYVIIDAGEALVVDVGPPTDTARQFLAEAYAEINLYDHKVTFCPSHFHIDHAGIINSVAREDTPVLFTADDLQYGVAEKTTQGAQITAWRLVAEGFSAAEAAELKAIRAVYGEIDPTGLDIRLVKEGDELRVGRYVFEVVDTAGHSPGHIGLYEPMNRIFFGGDCMLHYVSSSIDLFPDGRDSFGINLQTLRKLQTYPTKMFLVAHGSNSLNFAARIAWLIGHHEQRAAATVEYVCNNPGLSGFDAITQGHWNVPQKKWEDVQAAFRYTIAAEGTSLLNHLVVTEAIRRETSDGVNRYFFR